MDEKYYAALNRNGGWDVLARRPDGTLACYVSVPMHSECWSNEEPEATARRTARALNSMELSTLYDLNPGPDA